MNLCYEEDPQVIRDFLTYSERAQECLVEAVIGLTKVISRIEERLGSVEAILEQLDVKEHGKEAI